MSQSCARTSHINERLGSTLVDPCRCVGVVLFYALSSIIMFAVRVSVRNESLHGSNEPSQNVAVCLPVCPSACLHGCMDVSPINCEG